MSAALLGLGLPTFLSNASLKEEIIGHGDFKYRVNKQWGVLGDITPVNDCHEMVQDGKGRLILLNNETKNNIIIYDRSGKLVKSWGHDFPGGHGLTLSREGNEEFLFITDPVRHQVYKTTLDGRILLTLSYPKETGKYEKEDQFNPTEVAVAPNGDFYVADGYGLDYIIHYDHSGKIKNIFGGHGDGAQNLRNAHGVCVDLRDKKQPQLIVTSREEKSFKIYTLAGAYISTVHIPDACICRPVIHNENLYFSVLVSKMPWDSRSGFVIILDKNNKVISVPGGNAPEYLSGKLQPLVQASSKVFMHPHDVCIDNDHNIYVPQWNSEKTYPVKLERI